MNINNNKISGYITTKNAMSMDYPFVESIKSLVGLCDEVVVMDSSDLEDGTKDKLVDLQKDFKGRLFVYHANVNWKAPNHGIYDGVMKQAAREKCTGNYLFQLDADEIVFAEDRRMLEELLASTNNLEHSPLLALPVVEYWGSFDKVRLDINPWKWRFSKAHPEITHGIPISHRKIENGLLYSKPGSDSCDYIVKSQGVPVPFLNFMSSEIDVLRAHAMKNDGNAVMQYENWFNQMSVSLPTVFHFSWFSIKSKIYKYRDFFGAFWKAMYNDNRDTNVFFPGMSWQDVTDEMIENKAMELKNGTGGWIFHKPWDGSNIPHVKINRKPPEIITEWCNNHPI